MSNQKIDGVLRELLERLLYDLPNERTKGELRALLAKPADERQGEPMAMNRGQFEAWVLGREHPTYGWLDKYWLAHGDNPEIYADPYVQGLWVASQSLYTRPAEQPAPVAFPGYPPVPEDRQLPIAARLLAEVDRLKADSKRLAELDDQTIKQLGDRLRSLDAQHQGEPVYQFAVGSRSPSWVDVSEESHNEYKLRGGWLTRVLYPRPAEQPDTGTNSDKYKAELYDEVWQLARDMGFGNVTDALMKLKKQPAPVAVVLPSADDLRSIIRKAARDADLMPGANYYTAAELAAEDVVSEVARLNPPQQ